MNTRTIAISGLMLSTVIAVAGSALAQGMMGGRGQEMTGQGMMQGADQGMMRGMGGMMCPMMMGNMMQGGQAMTGSSAGMGALFGSRVVPKMNLSIDDVRSYLASQLDHLGNKRLKVGNVDADGGSITADIVTADNSLVQRMKIERSTGTIHYEN